MDKKLLEVYNFEDKIRLGNKSDGGYVICKLDIEYDCYISCGISFDGSFDRDFLKLYKNIGKNNSFAFDGTIEDYPWHYTNDITFIKKNISTFNDNNNTNLDELFNKYNNIFLSMDIESWEFPWILSLTKDKLKKLKQITIEIHGLNGDDWNFQLSDKIKCLNKLNETHYIMHAHGNNHGGYKDNIPDVLELTYINKDTLSYIPEKNKQVFPIKYLDYPNANKPDYVLNMYPFLDKNLYNDIREISNNFIPNTIDIGVSETNSKIINLDKIYPADTKLKFSHDWPDTFEYKFDNNELTITRTDINGGWGQYLIGYLELE